MDRRSISYIAVVAAVSLMSAVSIWSLTLDQSAWHYVDSPIPRRQVSAATDRIFQNDIYNFRMLVPAGWYLHERWDGMAILTKRERQTIPKETESWAIGEQIVVALEDMSASKGKNPTPEKWVVKNVLDKDVDDQSIAKGWEEVGGNRLFKVTQRAAGTDGRLFTYYAFNNGNVISLTLYPYDPDDEALKNNITDFEKMISNLSFVGLPDKKVN